MPASSVEPPHDAWNFTGIVLPSLKLCNGLAKPPPVASAPPIGGRKPAKSNADRVTLKAQVLTFPHGSVAIAVTGVVPMGKPEPEGRLRLTTVPEQASVAVTEN